MQMKGQFCGLEKPGPCGLVLFGASGDLTKRKIIPALYKLFVLGLLPERFFLIGSARTPMSDTQFREEMKNSTGQFLPEDFREDQWAEFSELLFYQKIDYSNADSYTQLDKRLIDLEARFSTKQNRIYYISTPPLVY
ncbi:MAG: glucose-6-phosphate dehydrogenase, partial [Nitrospirae bacterium]